VPIRVVEYKLIFKIGLYISNGSRQWVR